MTRFRLLGYVLLRVVEGEVGHAQHLKWGYSAFTEVYGGHAMLNILRDDEEGF